MTSLAFNRRQRDLLAACDHLGRVHVWRLTWGLSHKGNDEQTLLDAVGSSASASADASAESQKSSRGSAAPSRAASGSAFT